MKRWEEDLQIQQVDNITGPHWIDMKGCLVVPPDDSIRREIARNWHDYRETGHLERDETYRKIQYEYFWLGGRA